MNAVTVKRGCPALAIIACVVLVSALAGGALGLLNDSVLSNYWSNLGWRRPVSDWLIAIGMGDTVAGYWGLVWLHLPEWLIAGLLGICMGRCLRKRWLIGVIPCGLAFVFAGDLALLIAGVENPIAGFGAEVFYNVLIRRLLSVAIIVIAAFFSSGTGHGS